MYHKIVEKFNFKIIFFLLTLNFIKFHYKRFINYKIFNDEFQRSAEAINTKAIKE